jgi:hypothetical protein
MNVRVLHHPTIIPGTVIDATAEEAAYFVRTGRGEIVEVETATVEAPENAALRTTRPQPRTKPHGPK